MKKLFILFCLLWANSAFAETLWWGGDVFKGLYGSSGAACNAVMPPGSIYHHDDATLTAMGTCFCTTTTSSDVRGCGIVGPYTATPCPAGQSRTTGVFPPACNSGESNPPKPICKTPAGSKVDWAQYQGHSSSATANTPDAGSGGGTGSIPKQSDTCKISGGLPDSVGKCYATPASGGGSDFWCNYSGTSTGEDAVASGSDTPPPPAPSADTPSRPVNMPPSSAPSGTCPAGSVAAGTDSGGIPICIGTGSGSGSSATPAPGAGSTGSTTTKTVDGDGNSVETTKETTKNSDGSTTTKTTETTTKPDGSKSSTTSTGTGLTPSGDQGKADKPDQPDLCKQHPDLNICRNSSVSGTCGQSSCMGDAIQCATLRAAAMMQCQQQKDIDDLNAMPAKALGSSILGGADPMQGAINDALKGSEVDLSQASLDQNGFLGGGSCLADRTISVAGHAVPVSFSDLCSRIQPLRALIMACAFIVAYLLVSKSVLQG